MHPRNDAEPGTGTQYTTFASPPDAGDDKPCTFHANALMWKVGHDYLDAKIGDVCELVAVVGKSTWCDTRPPEECPAKLVFEYERYDDRIVVDPNTPEELDDRFIERYTSDPPLGAPDPPW